MTATYPTTAAAVSRQSLVAKGTRPVYLLVVLVVSPQLIFALAQGVGRYSVCEQHHSTEPNRPELFSVVVGSSRSLGNYTRFVTVHFLRPAWTTP